MKKVLFNWGGGKDSSLGLYKMLESGEYEICTLLTTVNTEYGRVSMHGSRETLLHRQVQHMAMPLHCVQLPGQVDMQEYNRIMSESLRSFREKGIRYAAFGDIFLENLRSYREEKLRELEIEALFPLWDTPTDRLAREFIDLGFKAVVSCVDGSKLDGSFVGREYDHDFLKDLPGDVDPCGEFGEFHSFVYDGPFFDAPVPFEKGQILERVYERSDSSHSFSDHSGTGSRSSHWFIDLVPLEPN